MEYTDDDIKLAVKQMRQIYCLKGAQFTARELQMSWEIIEQLIKERNEAREALVVQKKQSSDVVELLIDKINKILMETLL